MDDRQHLLGSWGRSPPAKRAKLNSRTSETADISLTFSRPTTLDTEAASTSQMFLPMKTRMHPDPALRKLFTAEELEFALRPVFDAVWDQDPESYPFRQPVDPHALGIPDYFDFIKEPMDLSTISSKLESGEYKTPWEFCKDMWLMFDNAWLYNKETSLVYEYCTKLSELFDSVINEAMQSLGYCCGMEYTFHPQVLFCCSKLHCTIPRDTTYYGYQNSQYVYCPRCFTEIPGDTIMVGDNPKTATMVRKSAFKEMLNDSIEYEPMVECIHCGREMHKICVLYHENIWTDGFQCENCLKAKHIMLKENKFSAKRLPTTKLALYLEERINNFIQAKETGAADVTIRVVSSSDKILDTCALMRDRFEGDFPESFPYRTKAIFVFEKIDGVDVCFFGMYVQEYGSDCLAPNGRRVYISLVDSVHFFRPRHLRTLVYHEILIGYLEFCKNNGYLTAHFVACPPMEGDDYIFHCHPVEQKIPTPKRLISWCCNMLDKGKSVGIVHDYMDIFKHCTEGGMIGVTEIPYFEGDFWPNVIEKNIEELNQEAKEREEVEQASGEVDGGGHGPQKTGKHSSNKKGKKKASRTRNKSSEKGTLLIGDDLSQKLYQTMEKHRKMCFVVLLQPPQVGSASPLPGTTDPDQLISGDLMDRPDTFLTMSRERHWEFSSLRRAKYSTMAILYELHNQTSNRFVYTCNNCHMHMETRYHCRECDDFDLCVTCYRDVGHIHQMDKIGLGFDEIQGDPTQKDPREQRKAFIQKCIQFLVHASQCRDPMCKQPSCIKMKRVLRHTRDCKLRMSGNCTICKQFLLLCYSHAKTCNDDKCPVPICARIKKNLKEQRAQSRIRQNRFMQQRMAQMSLALPSTDSYQVVEHATGLQEQHHPQPQLLQVQPQSYAATSGHAVQEQVPPDQTMVNSNPLTELIARPPLSSQLSSGPQLAQTGTASSSSSFPLPPTPSSSVDSDNKTDEVNMPQVKIEDLVIKSTQDTQLGSGSFGNVWKGTRSGSPCAVKMLHGVRLFLSLQGNIGGEKRKRFESECKFLERLEHPNIVQYLQRYIHPETGTTMLAMELMDENLSTFLERQRETSGNRLSDCVQMKICSDVAQALSYLHANRVVHRDLSSNNILLLDSTTGVSCRIICAKVSDFGISRLIDNERFDKTLSTLAPGTKGYMPPESWISNSKYNEKFDIFSFGVLVVQIITTLPPSPSDRADNSMKIVPEVKRRQNHLKQIEGHPLHELAYRCLQDDTTVRPTARQTCDDLQQLIIQCSCNRVSV